MMSYKCHSLAIIGAGNRGFSLARAFCLHPDRARIVAVVQPQGTSNLKEIAEVSGVSEDRVFRDHQEQ